VLPELRTSRLSLRPVHAADLDWLHALLIDAEVRRYLCDDRIMPRQEVADLLARTIGLAPQGLGMWVASRADGAQVGFVGLQPTSDFAARAWPDFAGEIEPTIALSPHAQGQGLATEVLHEVLRYGFDELKRQRIVAFADEPNAASRRMLSRAGFTDVGGCMGLKYRLRCFELRKPS